MCHSQPLGTTWERDPLGSENIHSFVPLLPLSLRRRIQGIHTMSTKDTYTPHPNSARWPFYAMSLFALICCIVMWRSCKFSEASPDATNVEVAPAK